MNMNMTILGQMISFAIFVYLCMKFVWPPLTAALAERQKKIAEGLDAADKAARELADAQQSVEAALQESKAQAAVLIEQANKRASQIVDEAKETALLLNIFAGRKACHNNAHVILGEKFEPVFNPIDEGKAFRQYFGKLFVSE